MSDQAVTPSTCAVLRCTNPASMPWLDLFPPDADMAQVHGSAAPKWAFICSEHREAIERGEQWLHVGPEPGGLPGDFGGEILMGDDLRARDLLLLDEAGVTIGMSYTPVVGETVKCLVLECSQLGSDDHRTIEIIVTPKLREELRKMLDWM